ncbi:GerAB/ArcD/ProY family transporter [Metabacillus bambusae]|uniref:GerAB/ArcD/ProY family transporter n=1 Tax=Metabacillus bambusae TaxID=2795218 RepID=A0ABS3NBB7_9BACI|nr:GerAB/ArcD/ProY family transporter [Metabacillus bambusae]MBO1515289.1 GerAB/ArcD/ProY family transporter [Metabacillus bambusae]
MDKVENSKISPGQLFSLIILFDMGTALVVSLGIMAEKDAWLAILLGAAGGLFLFFVYTSLFRLYPDLPLTTYMREILGKWIGWTLGLFYILFFLYGAARDVRDGGDLLVSSVLDQTPTIVISSVLIISVAYVLNKGIEVLARTAQIFLVILVILALLSNLLLLLSGTVEINRLLPVLGNGWGPVIKTSLKQTIEFPHGEVICFTMLLPYLNKPKKGVRAGFAAVLISGLILSYSSALNIAVLGTDIVGRTTFPMLYMISLINIGEFIQRLDVFVVLTLIIGDFFKVAIFFYAGVMAAADVFQIRDYRKLILPIGLLILLISMMITGSFAEHIEEGNLALQTVFVLFGTVIPLALLLVGGLRRRFKSDR